MTYRRQTILRRTLVSAALTSIFMLAGCGGGDSSNSTSTTPAPTPTPAVKYAALTFDDGPDATMTPKVLAVLDKYKVKATFMWIGQKVTEKADDGSAKNKVAIDAIVAGGHEVGNHGWGWSDMGPMKPEEIKTAVDDTTAAIKAATGKEPAFFLAPNLNYSDTLFANVPYPFLDGGAIAMDWDAKYGGDPTTAGRVKNVLDSVKDGTIILMHDVQPEPHPTPEALEQIIPKMIADGYKFVTVSELFKAKNVTPVAHDKKKWTVVE